MPIYMQYEGVKGNVTSAGYGGWIEIESCQLSTPRSPAVARAGRESSAPRISEIVVTKHQDAASPELFREASNGRGKKVTIAFCKSDKSGCVPYLKIELENVLISSYSVSGHGSGSDRPMESLSINFTKITYKTGSEAQLQNLGTLAGATR